MGEQVLGFVGLGRMGVPMSGRLAAAGHRVVGFDVAGTSGRLSEGVQAAESVADLCRRASIVFLSLPDGAASRDVGGQIAAARGQVEVVVDLSTIGTTAARECADRLRSAGVAYVDAPVSGGVPGARAGTLAIMVGGETRLFERLKPLLEVMGKNVFHVGEAPGLGQAMKLLNNYVAATTLAATSEAVVFGARVGLDLQQMVDVLNVSSGMSSASADKFPRCVVPRSYDYGFAGALMTKDVTLYLESAEATGGPREIASTVVALWQRFNRDNPGVDFTAMHRYLETGAEE